MPEERVKRTWQEIAAAMAKEDDDDKLILLCKELDDALLELERENEPRSLERNDAA